MSHMAALVAIDLMSFPVTPRLTRAVSPPQPCWRGVAPREVVDTVRVVAGRVLSASHPVQRHKPAPKLWPYLVRWGEVEDLPVVYDDRSLASQHAASHDVAGAEEGGGAEPSGQGGAALEQLGHPVVALLAKNPDLWRGGEDEGVGHEQQQPAQPP
eukprot:CAMPEP_0173458904 /NCGR_PEP_ID=MMETSP1357-20121228/60464_1 /TAXON_ID=77926 /ORGANISM="Hemiselmis rufescens, Strain PCC563" /LENGTH=155 /DNA_ID=CAMNT_0014426313 /DNA_START=83 /DNA_END=548 /DNA_ORIENTATION=+